MTRILIIDDHPADRELLVTFLGYYGHEILTARDGVEGLAIALVERPDLIITDILMPVMDGYELARRVRANPELSSTRLMFYTGTNLSAEVRQIAADYEVMHILTKPAEPEAILDTVSAALESAPPSVRLAPDAEQDRAYLRLLTSALRRNVEELKAEIQARSRAEDELTYQKERLQKIVDNIPVMIVFISPDGQTEWVNQEWQRVLGWTLEEVRSRDVLAEMYPDPVERQEVIDFALHPPPGWRDFRTRVKDSRVLDTSWANVLLSDGSSIGIGQDITERKATERELRVNEQRFRQLFARAPISIWEEDFSAVGDWLAALRARGVHDLDAFLQAEPQALEHALALVRLVDINDTTLQLFEVSSKEELLSVWPSLFTDETFRVFAEELRAIWEGRNRVDFECSAQTVRGRRIHYLLHWAAPLEDGRMNLHRVIVAIADITEHKQAEERIAFQAKLLDAVGSAVIATDPQGRVSYWNPAAEKLYGWSAAETLGRNILELTPAEESQEQAAEIMEGLAGGQTWGGEFLVRRKDGSTFPAFVSDTPILDDAGNLTGLIGVSNDITERKRAQDDLRKQQEILQTIFDNIPLMIGLLGADGRIALVNRGYERTLGWSLEEVQQHNQEIFADYFPDPRERQQMLGFLTAATGEWADFKTRVRDGRVIDTAWTNIRLSDGTTIGIGQDITERKHAEAERAFLAAIVESTNDAIIGNDLDGTILSWNRGAEQLYGYTADEVIARPIDILFPPDRLDELAHILEQIKRGERVVHYETRRVRNDGRIVEVALTTSPIRDSSGTIIGASTIARDITERKQAEAERKRLFEAVQASREQLKTLSQQLLQTHEAERRHLARELHDEIGQMLTGLNLLLEVGTAFSMEMLAERLREAQTLVADLTARVRTLSLDLRPSMLDDLGLLPTLLWHFERYTTQTQVHVRFKHSGLERMLDPTIAVVAYRIVQEALTNVARYAHVEAVDVQVWTNQTSLRIQVEDQGRGFDPDAVLIARQSSGLSGMLERTALLGGHVIIDSAPGEGTRIIAELPLTAPGMIKGGTG